LTQRRTGRIGRENYDRLADRIQAGATAIELGKEFDVFPETIRKFARRRGLTIQRHDQSMENHPSWTGGTTVDRGGYILKRVESEGQYGYLIRALRHGDSRGYAPVHRIVMHDKLGRALQPGEVVHHIDGDVKNNHPDNLDLYASNGEHLADTLKGRVPNWSPEGKARMTGRPPKHRQE
jgi:hypothetical protein